MTTPSEQDAELLDIELLRRAVTYLRAVGLLFGVDAAVAKRLCKRFGVDRDEQVAQ